jgi:hypothetical protein
MFANARLSFISVEGFHYSSGGQVILTVNPFSIASPFDRTRDTLSNRDRTRPNRTSIITMIGGGDVKDFVTTVFGHFRSVTTQTNIRLSNVDVRPST